MDYLWNLFGYSKESTSKRIYNWTPDQKDSRDLNHLFYSNLKLPTQVDLRSQCPPIYDQGELGSCTANAIAGAYEFDEMKQNEPEPFVPSRLFIYYNERKKEHHSKEDAGAALRDGIKSIHKQGVCHETSWPYDVSKFTEKPPSECYEEAKHHKAVLYRRVLQLENQFKQCLKLGFPFVFGIAIFESFETPEVVETGLVPLPQPYEKMLGGHAVLCVGYDDEKKAYIVRNSWGTEWGDEGYFYLPYDYMHDSNLASDFWTVIKVRDSEPSEDPLDKAEKELDELIAFLSEPTLENTPTSYSVPPPPELPAYPEIPEVPVVPKTPELPDLPEPIDFTELPPLPPSPELPEESEEDP